MEKETHAFLIQAHTEPRLLLDLVKELRAPNHFIYIHWDKRSSNLLDCDEFEEMKKMDNVSIYSCYRLNWGGVNQIKATLFLLNTAMNRSNRPTWLHLISGQDYPIRSNDIFDSFFCETKYLAFFSFVPECEYKKIEEHRLNRFHLNDYINVKKKSATTLVMLKVAEWGQKALKKCGFELRTPLGIKVYKGANWFSIHGNVANYFLGYCDEHPEYLNRYRMTSCCDEVFFHTLLMQSPFVAKICRDDLRYVEWQKNASSPEWLTERSFEKILSSSKMFCRKVSLHTSSGLISRLLSSH